MSQKTSFVSVFVVIMKHTHCKKPNRGLQNGKFDGSTGKHTVFSKAMRFFSLSLSSVRMLTGPCSQVDLQIKNDHPWKCSIKVDYYVISILYILLYM